MGISDLFDKFKEKGEELKEIATDYLNKRKNGIEVEDDEAEDATGPEVEKSNMPKEEVSPKVSHEDKELISRIAATFAEKLRENVKKEKIWKALEQKGHMEYEIESGYELYKNNLKKERERTVMKLIQFIKDNRSTGHNDEKIRGYLEGENYRTEDIELAFKHAQKE